VAVGCCCGAAPNRLNWGKITVLGNSQGVKRRFMPIFEYLTENKGFIIFYKTINSRPLTIPQDGETIPQGG